MKHKQQRTSIPLLVDQVEERGSWREDIDEDDSDDVSMMILWKKNLSKIHLCLRGKHLNF